MGQQMSLDTEAINTAVNKINAEVSGLNESMTTFLTLLNEKVNDTQGNFAIIATLEQKLQNEMANIRHLEETTQEIERVTRKYIEQAEEANDDSAFRD